MTDIPEKRSITEPLDIQRKIEDTLAGRRPIESRKYPHFMPDYEIPFLHIGTQKQLFLDNFIIDHLEDVERVFPEPYRPEEPILEVGDLPWEIHYNPMPSGAIQDPEDGKFKIWYVQSLSGDPFNTGQVLCLCRIDRLYPLGKAPERQMFAIRKLHGDQHRGTGHRGGDGGAQPRSERPR